MRKRGEIENAEKLCCDLVWYVRHKSCGIPDGTPQDIVDAAKAHAGRIEAKADPDYLAELLKQDKEYGMLQGRLIALRWMRGMDWADDGILDT